MSLKGENKNNCEPEWNRDFRTWAELVFDTLQLC